MQRTLQYRCKSLTEADEHTVQRKVIITNQYDYSSKERKFGYLRSFKPQRNLNLSSLNEASFRAEVTRAYRRGPSAGHVD